MSAGSMTEIWVYLSAQPLVWLTLTLAAYLLAITLHRKAGGHPAANPVLISVAILVALLLATDTPYQRYFDGAQFVHFLLGPATVALAVPLHGQLKRLVAMGGPILVALVVGGIRLSACMTGYNAAEATLSELKRENARLEHAYRTSLNLESVKTRAEELGMIPQAEAARASSGPRQSNRPPRSR